jgi:hypothetical protein
MISSAGTMKFMKFMDVYTIYTRSLSKRKRNRKEKYNSKE